MNAKILSIAAVLSAVSAFAAYDDVTYFFSSKGPDCYADGSQILKGERYAFVWSADTFGGFLADGSLVNPDDQVLGIYECDNDNGACSRRCCHVVSDIYKKGGKLALLVLDTRVYGADGKVAFSALDGVKLASVQGSAQVDAEITIGEADKLNAEAAALIAGQTALPADVQDPEVKGVEVKDGIVTIKVGNTAGFVNYGLAGGDDPANVNEAQSGAVTGNASGEIELKAPAKGNCGFFKVIRK